MMIIGSTARALFEEDPLLGLELVGRYLSRDTASSVSPHKDCRSIPPSAGRSGALRQVHQFCGGRFVARRPGWFSRLDVHARPPWLQSSQRRSLEKLNPIYDNSARDDPQNLRALCGRRFYGALENHASPSERFGMPGAVSQSRRDPGMKSCDNLTGLLIARHSTDPNSQRTGSSVRRRAPDESATYTV